MEAATLPVEQQDGTPEDGAPVEQNAEATRTSVNLFQYSTYIHVGADADECEHREDGKCKNVEHFHAWLCLPNSIQHRDILAKALAAKARRKRALLDAGTENRPASDAYVTLESDLDDELARGRAPIIETLAARTVRKTMSDRIAEVIEDEERFANYFQDAEEWRRLKAIPEDERPADEYAELTALMDDFEATVETRKKVDIEREEAAMSKLSDETFRETLRTARIELECSDAHMATYYIWLGFIGTRVPKVNQTIGSKRYFDTLEDFRNAAPEEVNAIDEALRDLEGRMNRGDASGN